MGRPATLRVDIVTDAKGASRGIDQTESKLGRFGSSARKFGKVAAVGLAAVGVAAVGAGVAVVKSASEQQQAMGAVDAVFGKSAAKVKRWAATAAQSVGLTKTEYGNLSALIGAQLEGVGFAADTAANKSKGLISTGADLAATFGGSVSDAVSAVSSLLKGETDPIERYGVSIKQADITARLAADGLDGLTGKALKQAKATTALTLLTEQTAKAHGQFSRESNTLAGQQERLKASFGNVKAEIGTALLPVVTSLFAWLNDKLLPGAKRLGGELATRFGPSVRAVGGFVTGTLVPALSSLFHWFMDKIYPSLSRSVAPILSGIRSAFRSVSSAVSDNSTELGSLARFIGRVIEAANPIRELFGKALGLAFRGAGHAIGGLISGVAFLVDGFGRLGSYVQWVMDKLNALKSIGGGVLNKLGGIFSTPVHQMLSPVTTGVGLERPGLGLNTSSLSTASVSPLELATTSSNLAQLVDARDFSVRVELDGAGLGLIDPGVVAKLERALTQHAQRMGRAPAFGGAR